MFCIHADELRPLAYRIVFSFRTFTFMHCTLTRIPLPPFRPFFLLPSFLFHDHDCGPRVGNTWSPQSPSTTVSKGNGVDAVLLLFSLHKKFARRFIRDVIRPVWFLCYVGYNDRERIKVELFSRDNLTSSQFNFASNCIVIMSNCVVKFSNSGYLSNWVSKHHPRCRKKSRVGLQYVTLHQSYNLCDYA